MDFSKITTDPELIERLRKAASREMTADEIHAQKVSWVYGQLPHDSEITKDQVDIIIRNMDGKT